MLVGPNISPHYISNVITFATILVRATTTASPGEGNSAVDADCEYGNFGTKQVTDKACCQFVILQTFYIWLSYNFLMTFDTWIRDQLYVT